MRITTIVLAALTLAWAGCGGNEPSQPPADSGAAGQTGGPSYGTAGTNGSHAEANGSADAPPSDDPASGPLLPLPDGLSAPPDAAPDSADPAATVHILDWAETLALVRQQTGKVVVLDLWSHNCLPCLRELPHFAALAKQYPDKVACIALNLDYTGLRREPPESFRDEVAETVGQYEAPVINVISSVPDQDLVDQIDLNSIPAVYVFDRQGRQVRRFDNDNADVEFTYEGDVVPLVESLLGDAGDAP